MPAISVIVPIYKAEKYLAQCVNSILEQTVSALELILVDDGSPDASPAICDAFAKKDARVRVIHKENGGVSAARKAGLAVATAPFVGFVDADDYIAPDMYVTLLEAAAQHDADLVECGYYEVDNGPEVRFAQETARVLTQQEIASEVLTPLLNETGQWNCFLAWNCWNKIYSTALLKKAMQYDDERIAIGEDMLQNVFYLTQCERAVVLAGACNYYYRRSDTSVMRAKSVHLGEVAYMQRGAAVAPQLGYTGDGFRDLMHYTLLHDLLNVMFYLQVPLGQKLEQVKKLVRLIDSKPCFTKHAASQGVLTKICLRLICMNVTPLQWGILWGLSLRK